MKTYFILFGYLLINSYLCRQNPKHYNYLHYEQKTYDWRCTLSSHYGCHCPENYEGSCWRKVYQ